MEDPHADHQIVIAKPRGTTHLIVSCTCLKLGKLGHVPLASGPVLPAGQAQAAWQAHMTTMRETHDGRPEVRGAGSL